MSTAKLFLSNRSQALRLPKDVAFPADVREVAVIREGVRRILVPAGTAWDDFFDERGVDLGERGEMAHETRESF